MEGTKTENGAIASARPGFVDHPKIDDYRAAGDGPPNRILFPAPPKITAE
jgi:hypothetical protein